MERVRLSDEIEFSRIAYGMWRLTDDPNLSTDHVRKKIELCIEQGITTFDQADIYGDYGAEEVLGKVLRQDKSLRGQMEIVTKCDIIAPIGKFKNEKVKYYDTSKEHLTYSVDSSLANMCIEQIDLLLIHRPDPFMDVEETAESLDNLVKSGKVKAIGVSNFRPWDWSLLQSSMQNKLLTNQIEFSLIKHEPLTNGDLSFHYKERIPIMAWSPLGGGDLLNSKGELHKSLDAIARSYDTDLAAVALSWILAHPSKIIPVVGTNNIDRISRLSEVFQIQLDKKTWYELYTAAIGGEVP